MIRLPSGHGELRRYVNNTLPPGPRVIDLGCGLEPHPHATTIVDIRNFPKDFDGARILADICRDMGGEYDLAFCSYALEDVAYPKGVLLNMCKMAKRLLIGVPHWTYEAGIRETRPDWDPVSGWPHHRWLFGINKWTGTFEFMAKYPWFGIGEYAYTQQYIHLEVDSDHFGFADITYDYPGPSKRNFLLAWLKERWE